MKRLSFKQKVLIFIFFLLTSAFMLDMFEIIEQTRFNYLLGILILSILVLGIQNLAARKGTETIKSLTRDYKSIKRRKLEHRYDWDETRLNYLKGSALLIKIYVLLLGFLVVTRERYEMYILIIWAIALLAYIYYVQPAWKPRNKKVQ